MDIEQKVTSIFSILYGEEQVLNCTERLKILLKQYGYTLARPSKKRKGWTHEDTVLITYGDVICHEASSQTPSLPLLERFIDQNFADSISTIHVLPFFPSSSDAGFSVMDYKKVRANIGSWEDVEHLAQKYRLMADLVINHCSRSGKWFMNYLKQEEPGKDYFIEIETGQDLSQVTRPRSSELVTTVETVNGLRHVWTTFSDDQIDLDFRNPDVLFKFLDIFLFYLSKGIRVIRLDAIAYLWKEADTPSIHLKETHQVVKLFRCLAECIDPDITLITETNVPFEENVSYFGNQDEAHMVYQFSLPPLLLHAILTENARYLTQWALNLAKLPEHCNVLNFTASHDGIGVRPLEGLVPDKEIDRLVKGTQERGGFVSYRHSPEGGQKPYELNITYFDAFEQPGHPRSELQIKRYLCSQIIMLSLKGVPGIYFHNLTATKNNLPGVMKTGHKRDINRKKWGEKELNDFLGSDHYATPRVFHAYQVLLKKRKEHLAFHPEGNQQVLELGNQLFTLIRTAPNDSEKILVLCNITGDEVAVPKEQLSNIAFLKEGGRDLLSESSVLQEDTLLLKPFQVMWLVES